MNKLQSVFWVFAASLSLSIAANDKKTMEYDVAKLKEFSSVYTAECKAHVAIATNESDFVPSQAFYSITRSIHQLVTVEEFDKASQLISDELQSSGLSASELAVLETQLADLLIMNDKTSAAIDYLMSAVNRTELASEQKALPVEKRQKARLNLALMLFSENRLDESDKFLNDYFQQQPVPTERAWLLKAGIKSEQKKYKESICAAKALYALNNQSKQAYMLMLSAHLELGDSQSVEFLTSKI